VNDLMKSMKKSVTLLPLFSMKAPVESFEIGSTGGPRYSRRLCSQNNLQIPKPGITRDYYFGILLFISPSKMGKIHGKLRKIFTDNKFCTKKNKPRRVKNARITSATCI
jgi:hypothetical protein